MKTIPLTQGKFTVVNDADYAELLKHKWFARKGNGQRSFYALRNQGRGKNRTTILMHREILGLKKGDGILPDHRDGNGLNNQRYNLRICTSAENARNRRIQRHSSKYKGVSLKKETKKWQAYINKNKKHYHLGYFKNEIEAAKTYDQAALEYFGEYANTNFKKGDLKHARI